MDKSLQKEIQKKKEIAINDFNLLYSDGITGFYTCCELTQIFLIELKTAIVYNYYTLINFEEGEKEQGEKYLTPKLLEVNKNYKIGILQMHISKNEALELFDQILAGNFALGENICKLSAHLILLPKQFVPQLWGSNSPLVSEVIKQNYWGDSYLIEFFDEDKSITTNFSRKEIDIINNIINKTTGIRISFEKIYDRIGNIIFQFPITLFNIQYSLIDNGNCLEFFLYKHPKITDEIDLIITAKASVDNAVTGYHNINTSSNAKQVRLELGDSYNVEIYVSRKNSSILYHHSKCHFLKYFHSNLNFSMQNSEPRTIDTRNGEKYEIGISNSQPMVIGRRKKREYIDYIFSRNNEEDIIRNSGTYKVFTLNEQKDAFSFVRKQVKINDIKEICLWDPYLNAADIIETIYFEETGLPFKCVTSYHGIKKINKKISENNKSSKLKYLRNLAVNLFAKNKYPKNKNILNEIKENQRRYFSSKSNNLNVKLEFRCQFGDNGYPFHDRFLILVPDDDFSLPTVFSLGTSINSLGKNHHMIQKVTNPRIILENFNKMWAALQSEECLIIKLPE